MPVAALLSGALLAGASLPACLGPAAFVGLVPLLRALVRADRSSPAAFRDGFVAGLVFFGVGFVWVLGSRVGGGLALPVTYALVIPLLASGLGLFALAVAWIARGSAALALAAAPGLWVAFEFARSQDWLFGIPWHLLGYTLADSPFLAQGASWFGVYGLSAWIVAVNGGLVLAPRLPRGPRLALAAALAAPLAAGLGTLGDDAPAATGGDALRVAAVQPAIEEHERHVPERLLANLRRLLDLSEPLASERADLIAWPESAWERALGGAGDAFLAAIAHHLGTPLVTGAWHASAAGGTSWRNAAVLASADGRTPVVAEKVHPVPVYERAPDGPVALALARAGLWSGRFGRGRPGEPLQLARAGAAPVPIGVLVCIDASHPELARALRGAGARLLVSLANEAGTGAWSAALHARIAKLRAIENGVPVVRVANTGPTLWIDARGRVRGALAAGEPAAAAHTLALAGPAPPYARIGERPVLAAVLLAALASVAARVVLTRESRRGVE
jgi:apolipoprotein N-acyltransferase